MPTAITRLIDVARRAGVSVATVSRHLNGRIQLPESTAARIERAIDRALADGLRTADLGGTLGTDELTRGIVERL